MTASLIEHLVAYRGIESNYTDAWGKPAIINPGTKIKLLKAMGYSIENETELGAQFADEVSRMWLSTLDPVQVFREGDTKHMAIRLPIELVTDTYIVRVTSEQGEVLEHTLVPIDGQLVSVKHIDDVEFQEYLLELPLTLDLGYYHAELVIDEDVIASTRLIVAPLSCYKPESLAQGKKVWGLSVQLYCLRSQNNWGIGDFTDLAMLVENAAKRGAQFVGLNPIHALYPANPNTCSPYGPSSRRWLNIAYIDVTIIEGYDAAATQSVVNTSQFQQDLERARSLEHVDYETVMGLKLSALEAVFDHQYRKYLSKNTKLNKSFKQFVNEGGESLQALAVYDTLQEELAKQGKQSWGWPVFPQDYADYHNPAVAKFAKKHAKRVKFFLWCQWQAAMQLAAVTEIAKNNQMCIGLYRDLAVGVSEGSAEIWGNKDLYCTDASVGAPPDVLGPLGQNWGLPPMDPAILYHQQYQPIIDLFRANMQATGALRIDHVMALLRLWWVVKGDSAQDGGYVYYPVDDLLAILALESHRHQSLVIGEDLGTVPEEIRSKLADNGVYSYRVFFFEQAKDGGFFSPSHYPEQSMSTLTTHDMPTLAGFWHCYDLELGKELGLYPTEEILDELYTSRHTNKQKILDTLHGHHSIPEHIPTTVEQVGMSKELNFGMQVHMAGGSSALLSLQLEDWLQMDKPVNIPGTFKEYPNWQRKLTHDLEHIFGDETLNKLATDLTQARQSAST